MTRIVTSRVFACMRQLSVTLGDAPWTPHPTTGDTPRVVFGGLSQDSALEAITLVGVPEDAATMDWVAYNPPVLDETFGLLVVVETTVAGRDAEIDTGYDAFSRLEELCDILQTALRDQATGQPIGGFKELDGNNVSAWKWAVSRVSPRVDPGIEGWQGYCEVVITFTTRI